jgi:TonB family protein
MPHYPWLLFVLLTFPYPSGGTAARQIGQAQQAAPQKDTRGVDFDYAPLLVFVKDMARRLDIDLMIFDYVPPQGFVTLHKDAPLSREDLTNLLDGALRDCGAMLVKSGTLYQVVPLSQGSGGAAVAVNDLPRRASLSRAPMVSMTYCDVSLPEVCSQIADMLNILPIMINPEIGGSVTLMSFAPISRERVFEVLLALLANNDAILIRSAGIYEIVPASKDLPAKWERVTGQSPISLESGIRRQRRSVPQTELESHVLARVEPALPAGRKELTGNVTIRISLDDRGDIEMLWVSESSAMPLAIAAFEAVKQWRFRPFQDAVGNPEGASGMIQFEFNEPGRPGSRQMGELRPHP